MSTKPPQRKKAVLLSNVLFALMLVAAGVVAYLYFFDNRFFNEGPEAPACESGQNELICVLNALKDQDFDRVEPGRYTASANQLTQPGQVIEIDKLNAFLFVYPAATGDAAIAEREADAADLDAATLEITSRVAENPLTDGEEVHVFQQSNVILILVGGTDEEVQMVQAAMETLP
ncbi:MAG: hypothetical protein KC435_08880 [Thermomicrobiales bacterium]|nr:hypothetical protein [Thermomicrobiales bacterium]